MAFIVTICIMVITVYTVMDFKNRKAIKKDIKLILEELEYNHDCKQVMRERRLYKQKRREEEENEENGFED